MILVDLEIERVTLPDWLHETYFDEKKLYFSEAHIEDVGEWL